MTAPYNDALLRTIELVVSQRTPKGTDVGTVVSVQTTNMRCMVIFDGATVATPVKVASSTHCQADDRVGLTRYGSDWYVTDILNRVGGPNGAGVSQAGQSGTTTSTTATNLPGNPSFTWSKRWDLTPMLLCTSLSLYSTGVISAWGAALGFTGSGAVQTVYTVWTVEGGALNTRLGYSFQRIIPDPVSTSPLPADDYTVNVMWFRAAGTGTLNQNTSDYVSASVLELGG